MPVRAPVLVLGVGSELRSDDAAGRRVAEAVAASGFDEDAVEVRSVHQLTPELADSATGRRLLVVIDASVDVDEIAVRRVTAAPATGAMTHHLDVPALLGLAAMLGAPPEDVVTVALPARSLALGTALSPATVQDVEAATRQVIGLCRAFG